MPALIHKSRDFLWCGRGETLHNPTIELGIAQRFLQVECMFTAVTVNRGQNAKLAAGYALFLSDAVK